MTTPYRSALPALLSKREAIETELDPLHARREANARALELAREVEVELAAALDRVSPLEPTPLLDRVRIASPCQVPWGSMRGDDVTRFCGSCRKNVYNLSAMTRTEAEAFLATRQGGAELPCLTWYRRLDGTLVTADCPTAKRGARKKLLVYATVAAAAAAAAAGGLRANEVPVVQTAGGPAL